MRLSGEGNDIQGKGTSDQGGIVGSGRLRVELVVGSASLLPLQNARLAERGEGSPIAKLGFPVVRGWRGEIGLLFSSSVLVGCVVEILPYY